MNPLDFTPDDFNAYLAEMYPDGGGNAGFLRQQYREKNNVTSMLPNGGLADGRQPVAGGFASKDAGATGRDAMRSLRPAIWNGIRGLLQGGGESVQAPLDAYRGLLSPNEMTGAAMGTAGMAMGGGMAATAPRGALRSGLLRDEPTLPTPRNDAEAMAKQVLEMRAAGNAGDVTDGIRAFHGSPHDFDKFSMDNLGTGEGAQVYGQGLYLAEAEGTAKMYRDTLSQQNASAAQRALTSSGGDVQEAISKAKEKILHYENLAAEPGAHEMAGRLLQINRQKLSDLETGASPAGKMYEVNIAANADDFLDYDLPLNQQPQRFAPDINAIADIQGIGKLDQFGDSASFRSFLDELEKKAGPTGARQEFTDAGIPGIKYLDADSRSAGKGSRNFVVFDDKLISIVRKYGIAGAATMLGVSALDVEQAMAQGSPPKGLLSQADQRQQRRGLLE